MQIYKLVYKFLVFAVVYGFLLYNSSASWVTEVQEIFVRHRIIVDTNVLRQAAIEAMAHLIDPLAKILTEDLLEEKQSEKKANVIISELDNGICYIKLDAVNDGVYNKLYHKLSNQQTNDIWSITLDLRDSSGEGFSEIKSIAGLFFAAGDELYRVEDLQGNVLVTNYTEGVYIFQHCRPAIVILVNEQTSGASELLTAVLKGKERTLVIGKRTKGELNMQEIIEIPGNIKLLMCTKRIRLRNGIVLSGGIEPDVNYEAINEKEIKKREEKQIAESSMKKDKGIMFALHIMYSLRALNLTGL